MSNEKRIIGFLFIIHIFAELFLAAASYGTLPENLYFDYPISVESYNPYSFGRPLGAYSSFNQTYHTGEDFTLPSGTEIKTVGKGKLKLYKTNGGGTANCPYVGYGKLYAIIHYRLNRPLRVPIGDHTENTSQDFTMVFGHILNVQDLNNPQSLSTEIEINNNFRDGENIFFAKGERETIGWVAPSTAQCANDDYNGDGDEHLHHGIKPGLVDMVNGYSSTSEAGYYPPHLVIAASRIGVFKNPDGSLDWKTDGRSQTFVDKWWEQDSQGNYKYMELNNYHNKLGRPNNNHPNAPNEGTDFVHLWKIEGYSGYRVYIQDFYQPYEGHSRFGTDGKTAIILNDYSTPYKAYLVKEGIWGYYKTNNGPYDFGMPFTEEITYHPMAQDSQLENYAHSPHVQPGDFASPGDTITVQKFMRVFESNGILIYNNERKTIVYNWRTQRIERFPVGEFSIGTKRSENGVQWYVTADNNPANDIAWPAGGIKTPTGSWFTKPGTYNFVRHDASGQRLQGYGFTAVIIEGNSQGADPPLASYNLSILKSGPGSGTVTSSSNDINCGSACSAAFNPGATVTLTATADTDSTFLGWSGVTCLGVEPCTITMDEQKTVTATFSQPSPTSYTLTVNVNPPEAGTVISSSWGVNINCSDNCSVFYDWASNISLGYYVSSGYVFDSWSGCDSVSTFCYVEVGYDRTVTANFRQFFTISAKGGSGGGIDPFGDVVVFSGENRFFTISPSTGYHIANVKVDDISVGVPTTYLFSNVTSSHTINATFAADPYILAGDINGDGVLNLADAIIALRILAGMKPTEIRSDYVTSGADVSGNDQVGLSEVLYILQKLANLRPPIIESISPQTVTVGDPGFTLTVTGSNFDSISLISLGLRGSYLNYPATFINNTTLALQINTTNPRQTGFDKIFSLGDGYVQVIWPYPSPFYGQKSNKVPFTLFNPIPVIESISGTCKATDLCTLSRGYDVKINGTGFVTNAFTSDTGVTLYSTEGFIGDINKTPVWTLTAIGTGPVYSQMQLGIHYNDIPTPGIYTITVCNEGTAQGKACSTGQLTVDPWN